MVPPAWRKWATPTASLTSATSIPLHADAHVRNRLFPKTRSWFALDAPLALLSPLSVLRLVFAFGAVTWILMGALWTLPHSDRTIVFIVGTTALVAWASLLRVRRVSVGWSWALSCLWIAQVSVLLWAGHGGALSVATATYFVPIGVFVALYFAVGVVAASQVIIAMGVWVALTRPAGVLPAAFIAVVLSLSLSTASFAILLLMRSSRNLGTFDPESGLPNGLGITHLLAQRDSNSPLVVIAVVVRGVDSAQEALGFQAGSELMRRAVEDIGQVLPSDAVIGRIGDAHVCGRPGHG